MKTHSRKKQAATVSASRWLAYAGAAAATALGTARSAHADIHFSGPINMTFPPGVDTTATFQLDQPADFFVLKHDVDSFSSDLGGAFFRVEAVRGGDFRGQGGFDSAYVAKIGSGRYISQGEFLKEVYTYGTLVKYGGGPLARWKSSGTDFIGFRFNNGAGVQYGWARIQMSGRSKDFAFRLLDYAYADPSEPIKAGQRSSATASAPARDSLGWLALGGAGLVALRGGAAAGGEL